MVRKKKANVQKGEELVAGQPVSQKRQATPLYYARYVLGASHMAVALRLGVPAFTVPLYERGYIFVPRQVVEGIADMLRAAAGSYKEIDALVASLTKAYYVEDWEAPILVMSPKQAPLLRGFLQTLAGLSKAEMDSLTDEQLAQFVRAHWAGCP